MQLARGKVQPAKQQYGSACKFHSKAPKTSLLICVQRTVHHLPTGISALGPSDLALQSTA